MGGLAGVAAHLDGAGQLIGQALLIRRNGDGDALTGGVAAEVIHAVVAAGIGLEGVAVAVGVVQGEVVVIHTRHLLLGAHQPGKLQLHRLAGLDLGILRQLIALGVQQLVADATGGDDLIGGHAVLLYPDDMAAGGEVRHRHGAGLGVHGDTLRGEAVEGHGLTHGGAGHGNGAAALRSEGVAGAAGAKIEQDVVLGIQLLLLVLGDADIHTIHEHIGLDGGAVSTHGYHKHTGELRPDGGEGLVGGAALALLMGHGVVGDLHQRRTLMVGGHIGQAAVVGIGSDAHHVAGLAAEVHHLVVGIRQGDLGVHEALNGLPVTEHIQLIGVAGVHVHVALGVDVQIHIAQIVGVLIEPADGILVEIVVHMQIVTGHDDILIGGPLVEVPIGHTVGILHPHEVVQAGLRHPIGHGDSVAVLSGDAVLLRTEELIGIVVAEGTHADGGAGRSRHLHGKGLGYGDGEGLSAAAHLRDNGLGANVVICSVLLGGDQVHRHGIRLHEDTRGAEVAVNGAAAQRGSALHAVGGGQLIVDGVVGACHPAAVAGIDLIGTLYGNRGGIISDDHLHAAVAVLVGVVALHPIGAGGQLCCVLQPVAVCHSADAGQQILRPLHAVLVGVQLQAVQLCVVQALQLHRMDITADHLDLLTGVHQRIGRMRVIGGGGGHQITGRRTLHHSEGRLAVFIGHHAVNGLNGAGGHIQPCQTHALQRPGGRLQLRSVLVAIALHGIEALHRHGDGLAGHHGLRDIDPRIVVGIRRIVGIEEEIHGVAVIELGVHHRGAIIAGAGGCLGAVIGIAGVDIEAADIGLRAVQLGDKAAAADLQEILGGFRGKVVAEGQLVGDHQRIQSGNALHLVGVAVLLRLAAGKFSHHGLVQPCAAVLRPNQHLGIGGSNRLVVRLHLHVDGVDLCRLIVVVHIGPAGIAALDGDGGTVHSGNHRRALILRLAHIGPDLIVLVAGGGGDQHAVGPLVHRQGILMGVRVEGGGQLTGAEGQGLHRLDVIVPAAAQVGAVAIAGIHDPDLVAGSQRSGRHGEVPKAAVGEPIIQGSHPAGHGAAVEFTQTLDRADVVVLGACLLVAVLFQCLYNTAHHGRIFIQIYPFLHQCPFPGSALGFRVGGVLHDDMNLSVVVVRRKNAHGYQRQYHHQRQKQRYNAFLHSFLSSLLQIYFEGGCPKNTAHIRRRQEGWLKPLLPLWKWTA